MSKNDRTAGRQRLIDAALDCLAEHGYHGSSVRKIAASAGVTAGLLKYYFNGKSELMIEAYRHFRRNGLTASLSEAEAAGADPVKRLEAFTRAIFYLRTGGGRRLRLMKIWISFLELVIKEPKISAEQSEVYELYAQELSNCVKEIYANRGETLASDAAWKLAIGIHSVIDGVWLECSLNPSRMTPDEALEIALDLIGARIGVSFSESF